MLHLLSIEILKLYRNRQFMILTGVLILSVSCLNYLFLKSFELMPDKLQFNISAWNCIAFLDGFAFILPAMIVIMHTCAEYTYRTSRQNIIDGLTRRQYVATKLAMVVALALFTTILVFLSAAVSLGFFPYNPLPFELKYAVYFFMQALTYLVFAFFLALFIKRSILSLSIFVVYSLILDNYFDTKWESVSGLLPLSACDHLIPPPGLMSINFLNYDKPEWVYLACTCAYLAAFCSACFYKYEKQDL